MEKIDVEIKNVLNFIKMGVINGNYGAAISLIDNLIDGVPLAQKKFLEANLSTSTNKDMFQLLCDLESEIRESGACAITTDSNFYERIVEKIAQQKHVS